MNRTLSLLLLFLTSLFLFGCSSSRKSSARPSETKVSTIRSKVVLTKKVPARKINTKKVDPDELVSFAETLIGVPYRYGSAKKENGFDCSGFIYYVFTEFGISVPRSSADFTNAGQEVMIEHSRRGDIILFTGSNPSSGVVGHMGIVTENKNGLLRFIHSASGNKAGVMISGMNAYFTDRFVKVNRIFSTD